MRIEVDGWRVGIRFSASHFIPGHGKCSRLHGHDYGVRVALDGEMGEGGMLYDFVELKKVLRAIVEEMDHRLLLPSRGETCGIRREDGEIRVEHGGKSYVFPVDDVCFIDADATTAEGIAHHIARKVKERVPLPPNVRRLVICVEEGPGQGACVEVDL